MSEKLDIETDIEKVLLGLKQCVGNNIECAICPYRGRTKCYNALHQDTIAVINQLRPVDVVGKENRNKVNNGQYGC